MTDHIEWIIDVLFTHETGAIATLIEQGKLKAYDRFDRFGLAQGEQCTQALDAISRHVKEMEGQGRDDYLFRLATGADFRNILTTAGFLADDLRRVEQPKDGAYLRCKIVALNRDEWPKALLEEFRTFGGKRRGEPGQGRRGALARLERATGIDDKDLGKMLDKAIASEALGKPFEGLLNQKNSAK